MQSFFARLAVALGFAVVAAAAAGALYQYRDSIFEWSWAKSQGRLVESVPAELSASARDYAESRRPGQSCVARAVARDDRYVYADVGCGKFEGDPSQLKAGDVDPVPTRFRYRGNTVSSWEQPDRAAYENSFRRLFPLAVDGLIRFGLARSEYYAGAQARTLERARAQFQH